MIKTLKIFLWSNFKNYTKKIDIFAKEHALYFQNRRKFSTLFGGLLTLFLITFFSYLLIQNLFDPFNEKMFNISEIKSYQKIPRRIEMNNKNFMFAMGFLNLQIDPSKIFTLKVTYKVRTRNFNKTTNRKERENTLDKEIPLVKCTVDHFGSNYSLDLNNNLKMEDFYCPSRNFSFDLEGSFISDRYAYVSINLKRCFSCFSGNITEFYNIYSDLKNIIFKIVFFNNEFLLQNKEIPVKSAIHDETYFHFNPTQNKIGSINIFYQSVIITTEDKNLFSKKKSITNSFFYAEELREQFIDNSENTEDIMTFYFRSSYLSKDYERGYKNLLEIISYIGGLWNPFYFISLLIASRFNYWSYLVKMSNSYYYFERKNPMVKKLSKRNKYFYATQTQKEKHEIISKIKMDQSCDNSKKIDQIENYLLSKKKIRIKLIDFLRFFFFCTFTKRCKKRKKKLKMAASLIKKDLDLSEILNKVKEFEKIKSVLFSKNLISLINFQTKSKIDYNSNFKLKKKTINPFEEIKEQKIFEYKKHLNLLKTINKLEKDKEIVNNEILKKIKTEFFKLFEQRFLKFLKENENELLISNEIRRITINSKNNIEENTTKTRLNFNIPLQFKNNFVKKDINNVF